MDGRRLLSSSFLTGWRINLLNGAIEYPSALNRPAIVLRTKPDINGKPVHRQFFVNVKDKLRLVRIENEGGRAFLNGYGADNWEIGMAPVERSVPGLLGLLRSTEPAEVLSALVFLGGEHGVKLLDLLKRESIRYPEFLTAFNDPEVMAEVAKLTQSANPWIKEAAVMALVPLAAREW